MARNTTYALYATGKTDPTFSHIWAFQSVSERNAFLSSTFFRAFDAQKYWRVGRPIKIALDYETSFKVDYAIITNKAGTSEAQSWYCFVTNRRYISNTVTELTLEVDTVQTFYFNIDGSPFWQCDIYAQKRTNKFVPRRGIASDYAPQARNIANIDYNTNSFSIVIYSSVDLREDTELKYTLSSVEGVVMASAPYLVKGSDQSDTLSRFTQVIEKINNNGWTNSISNICVAPNVYLTNAPLGVSLLSQVQLEEKIYTIQKPTKIGEYVPVNKTILEQDYCYVVVDNNLGDTTKYRFDDFESGIVTIVTGMTYNSGTVEVYARPRGLKETAIDAYRAHVQKMTSVPLCSYDNDTYKIWLAQTINSRNVTIKNAEKEVLYAKLARAANLANQLSSAGDASSTNNNALNTYNNNYYNNYYNNTYNSSSEGSLPSTTGSTPALTSGGSFGGGSFGSGRSKGGGGGRNF